LNTSLLLAAIPGRFIRLGGRRWLSLLPETAIDHEQPSVESLEHALDQRVLDWRRGGGEWGAAGGRTVAQGVLRAEFHSDRPVFARHPSNRVLDPLLAKRVTTVRVLLIIPRGESYH
jgi:hypothetical protein